MQTVLIAGTVLGGLAVFIFGIHLMSDGLLQGVGDRMQGILSKLTSNLFVVFLIGALITIILQSAAATIIMAISFVNARFMKLSQAIAVTIGANLGGVVTSQIIAFNIGSYAWGFVFIGFVLLFFLKSKEIAREFGQILMGFGLMFVAMNTMRAGFLEFAEMQGFMEIVRFTFDIPVIAMLLGVIFSFALNSSTAVIAVVQSCSLTYQSVVPIVIGANLGVAIMTLLIVRRTKAGKRVGLFHILFNLFGVILMMCLLSWIVPFISELTPQRANLDFARNIANTHLIFNLLCTIVFLPLIKPFEKLLKHLIPSESDEKNERDERLKIDVLDENLVEQPVAAMQIAIAQLVKLGQLVTQMLVMSKKAFISGDIAEARDVVREDKTVNLMRAKTIQYIAKILASDNTTDEQKGQFAGLYHIALDIEHIGDYCKNIATFGREKETNGYTLSDKAYVEIYKCFDMIKKMMDDTFLALAEWDGTIAKSVLTQEKKVNDMEMHFKEKHVKRLEMGECSTPATVIYVDTLHNLERIGDSCTNIAGVISKA